jgi:hypothetical protein
MTMGDWRSPTMGDWRILSVGDSRILSVGDRPERAGRAVSAALSYTLILGIVTLLLTGLTAGFAPLVTNQQADAAHTTLEVLGNDIAGDLERADRLAVAAGPNGTVVLQTRLPERVSGSTYDIEIEETAETRLYELTLTSRDHETSATVRVRTEIEVDAAAIDTIDGGPIEIAFDGSQLVIRRA